MNDQPPSISSQLVKAAKVQEKVLDQIHLQNQPQNSERKSSTKSHHQSCEKG